MFSPEKLGEIFSTTSNRVSPGGISCYFIKIDNVWGLKVYKCEYTRDKSHKNQGDMAKHGLAPKVGDIFNIGDKYCFVTEIAEPLVDGRKPDEDIDAWLTKYYAAESNRVYRLGIFKARQKMSEVGYHMTDVHSANFGYMNGEIVCIDFGE